MTINDTHTLDQGEIAYAGLTGIESWLESKGYKLDGDSDDAIHEALWDAMSRITVRAA